MPRFAANLSMLWPELDVYDRFQAAAEAGFRRIEILFIHRLDLDRVERLLRTYQLELVLFDPSPGNWEANERGLLTLPGRQAEFLQTIQEAIATARRFGVQRLNCLAGVPSSDASRADGLRIAVDNLRIVAPLARQAGVKLLIENINPVDMPGYFTSTPDQAAELVAAADQPNVRLQLDQYHVGMVGGDPRAALREHLALVEHVQIADVPGRHEPGSGQQPIGAFLDDLDRLGYAGNVGLEYRPSASTEAALAWLPRDRRA